MNTIIVKMKIYYYLNNLLFSLISSVSISLIFSNEYKLKLILYF